MHLKFPKQRINLLAKVKKGKGSPYSITERKVPELILAVSLQMT